MAPTVKKPETAAAAAPAKGSKKKPHGTPRNYDLGNGVVRFSRSRTYHKKALYKFMGKKTAKAETPKKPVSVEKPIGGDKNGGTRTVKLHKRHGLYPTQKEIAKHPSKKCFRHHKRHLRPTLQPGTICIVLAGQHKGKRVVLLKQLDSGLLLVTGPFLINACPLRRISQNYVIATSTRLDVSGVKLPEHINDDYFKRQKNKRAKKEEGDIFAAKKEAYKPTEQRKNDQKLVDKMVLGVIKKHPDHKLLYTYLSAMFGLKSSQYPHRMKF
ncbi:60S ribosomal protein L6 [Ctenocephalides felis]|uniref:60S ribosomal protein L6 n=1 Tax=Ctenocephalides felis TaxID=7515 RepID=UPI000E6E2525|nr:60S ribosomal protein L6 [Ctenocephalides felis]XP_026471541.1 60S ribosomal protein L6 [Ctenocephalides felis]